MRPPLASELMALRIAALFVLSFSLIPSAWSQTVRFDTNVGNIDLVLNPTNDGNLNQHVDNILRYVESGRYEQVVLNRAADTTAGDPSDDFVLQFGGFFLTDPIFSSFNAFGTVQAFDPLIVDEDGDGEVDFSTEDLTNTRGTVSLALSNSPNTGTSSFFVNVGNNEFLDASGFVPFAVVEDMSTVDYILQLNQVSDPSNGLASADIPVIDELNTLVYVERAFVLDPDPVSNSMSMASMISEPIVQEAPLTIPTVVGASVPEPPALVLALGAFMVWTILKGPRR